MANPEEALKVGFDGYNTFPYSEAGPGHLEPDDFYINNVALKIPPVDINIDKQAFNHEWQTLRTPQSQKVKSGFSNIRINFSIIFKVSDMYDRNRLRHLVAGLRATPFCVIHNQYLEKMLGTPDITGPVASATINKTIQFRPIMLAMSSMTFETMGHERKPDCVRGTFDFLWFNYLPLTKTVAFKAGADASRPGHAWESPLWEQFYKPFVDICSDIIFPHELDDLLSRTTTFMWREFLTIPKGHPAAAAAAKDLVDALKNRPKKFLEELQMLHVKATSSDNPNPNLLTEGTLDSLYRRLVKQDVINPNKAMHEKLKTLPSGVIEGAAGDVLSPVVRKIYGKDKLSSGDMNQIDIAASILASRLKKLKGLKQRGDISFETAKEDKFQKIFEADIKSGTTGNYTNHGGLSLFGRKKYYRVEHGNKYSDDEHSAVIQQVIVTFENVLASIPMVGYRYPLLQHVGSMDARTVFVINAKNTAAGEMNSMYDNIEKVALRYKQIPAGLVNLYIENDFLKLFGLTEFITENISTRPIEGQPSRSMVQLSLTQPGITSDTTLDDPEQLKQELLPGSTQMYKEIWKIIFKDTEPRESVSGKKNLLGGSEITEPTETEYYYRTVGLVSSDKRNSAYKNIIKRAVDSWNDFVNRIHKKIFNESGPNEAALNYSALQELSDETPGYGFIPGMDSIRKDVDRRNKAYRAAGLKTKGGFRYQSNKSRKAEKKAIDEYEKYSGNLKVKEKKSESIKNIEDKIKVRINEFGWNTYKREMEAIFKDVRRKYLSLSKFKSIARLVEKSNIDKGIMAYPDFKKQLDSVVRYTEGTDVATNAQLLKYDPDCYFWYDLTNGGASSQLTGVVDDYYITEAKKYSVNIVDEAQERVPKFFKTAYQMKLKNPEHMGPYNVLTQDGEKTELANPLYVDSNIVNSISAPGNPISKNITCDPHAKIPINWYPEDASERVLSFNSDQILHHTTSMKQQCYGIKDEMFSTPSSKTNANDIMGDISNKNNISEFEIKEIKNKLDWPINPPPKDILPGSQYGAIRRSNKYGIHRGIDMPEKSRGNRRYGINDGIYGTPVLASGTGNIKLVHNFGRIGGLAIYISHGNGWETRYFHLRPGSITVKKGDTVQRGKKIAEIGRTGIKNSATHLHFGVAKNNQYLDPLRVLPPIALVSRVQRRRQLPRSAEPLGRDTTSTIAAPLDEAIKEFERDIYNGQGQSMLRAYPAFKLYFIEDDSTERRLAFDDFFSYGSIQSIRIVRSRKIAADYCELYLTNISGVLSNRKFRQLRYGDEPRGEKPERLKENGNYSDTEKENPIASLLLQEGININLKLGYVSDPNRMENVFNGVITEVQFSDSDDLVRIVAQSHAIELVQDIKGIEKPRTKTSFSIGWEAWDFWGFTNDASTGRILEEMLAEPEILHFGRWTPDGGGMNPVRDLLTQRWTFQPQPADDNIFAPSPRQDLGLLSDGLFFKDLKYIIYRTTVWDIFQEMTLRHPNFIASAVPYQDLGRQRMTMFFGLPNQLYFARHPSWDELNKDEELKREQEFISNKRNLYDTYAAAEKRQNQKKEFIKSNLRGENKLTSSEVSQTINQAMDIVKKTGNTRTTENEVSNWYREKRLNEAKKAGYIKPFRNYHLLTSANHIIYNNIRANSRDVANTITIKYPKDVKVAEVSATAFGIRVSERESEKINIKEVGEQEFTLKLDSALPTEEIRTQVGQFINVTNEDLAKRYALGLLCRNLKEIYKGEIVIVGNPKIKPNDVCFCFDEYSDMIGPIEVEEVQHVFDQQHGFRTEIKPDMMVQAVEWSLLGTGEALGIIMENSLRKIFGSYNPISLMGWAMGHGLSVVGGFLSDKIINYTQLAQPVIMVPLKHHGRIFAGGVPTRKIPTSVWNTEFGKWNSSNDVGYRDWKEDKWDEIIGWTKAGIGRYSVGNFWNNGGDSPE